MTSNGIPHQARNVRRYRSLFDGFDTGLYTLPAEAVAARDGLVRLSDELTAARAVDMTQAENAYLRALIDAARSGETLPDVAQVRVADEANGDYNRRTGLLARALDQADSEVDALLASLSDLILREHLAPAVNEVMKGVRAAAEVLPEDIRPEALLRAADKARRAYLTLDDLAARYDGVRRAASPLRMRTPAEMDNRGDFSELRNFDELTVGMNLQMGGPRPWPTETAGRLLWYARHGGQVWLPTVREQDDRYREVHKEALAQQAQNRHRVSAAQHAFG